MKNDSAVPRGNEKSDSEQVNAEQSANTKAAAPPKEEKAQKEEKTPKEEKTRKEKERDGKKKKKRNLWPLKVLVISLLLSFAVNAGAELVLQDTRLWVAALLAVIILALGVLFDMIGTAATSCDVQPFLSMASRKVKGAKMAMRLAKNCDVVSSVCCDVVGDICGVFSGVCAATIAVKVIEMVSQVSLEFWIRVIIYALISTATISLKAVGKGIAVKKANGIVFGVAKVLSVFSREK